MILRLGKKIVLFATAHGQENKSSDLRMAGTSVKNARLGSTCLSRMLLKRLTKTLIYKTGSLIITFGITWLILGTLGTSLLVTALVECATFLFYFLFEGLCVRLDSKNKV